MGKGNRNRPEVKYVPMTDERQALLLELSHGCVSKGVNGYLGHIHRMQTDKVYRKAHPSLVQESNVARDKSAEALHASILELSSTERVDMLMTMLYPSVDANTRTALFNLANSKGATTGETNEGKQEPKE